MRQDFNKLVRDKIPEIIERSGAVPHVRVLSDQEYKEELLKKVVEEARELAGAQNVRPNIVKEIGDIYEVLDAVINAFELDKAEIRETQLKRQEERGGFRKKIFLEYAENSQYEG